MPFRQTIDFMIQRIDMEINTLKTKCMMFSPSYSKDRFLENVPKFSLHGMLLEFHDRFKYLGLGMTCGM
jgi:hypothetical protein